MTTSIESPTAPTMDNLAIPENEPVALLIAIEDYRAYDASGKSDLRAGRNDVIAYWKVCRRLGYEPRNIWVLTSPKLSPSWIYEAELDMREDSDRSLDEFDERAHEWCAAHGVQLGEATRANIEASAAKLSAGIMDVRETESEFVLAGSRGFLAYSGHGMRIDDELALCPSDIEKDHLKAIKLGELKSWILGDDAKEGKELGRNLTVVLDCCFAAAQQNQTNAYQRVTSLGEAGTASGKRRAIDLGSRVFCAAGPGEQSYQALLGGYWYSAFTWAFTVALEQWQIHERDAAATISHNELLFRTRMLLEALSFKQHPQLLGKFGLSNEPVFGHYDIRGRGTTSVNPNAERSEGQLNPDYKYTIILNSNEYSVVLAEVVVVPANKSVKVMLGDADKVGKEEKAGPYGTEFWYVNRNHVGKLGDNLSHTMQIKVASIPTSSTITPSIAVDKDTTYQANSPVDNGNEWSSTPHLYVGNVKNYFFAFGTEPKRQIVQLNVAYDTRGTFLNGVQWYVEGPSNSAHKGTIKPMEAVSTIAKTTLASPAYGNRFYARTSIPAPW